MRRRLQSGWITGRGQIAFILGLVIALGLIVWLDALNLEPGHDPLGADWVDLPDPPAIRSPTDTERAAAMSAIGGVAARARADGRTLPPLVHLAGAAACTGPGTSCGDAFANGLPQTLVALVDDPLAWSGSRGGPIALSALAVLVRQPEAEAALAPYRAALDAIDPTAAPVLPAALGWQQFAARSAALGGREFPEARSYASLRPVFRADDGLARLGASASTELVYGLGLIATFFPDHEVARRLLWRLRVRWPEPAETMPVPVLAMFWSQFADPGLDAAFASRVGPGRGADGLDPIETAILLLALGRAAGGPLLAR